MALHDWTRDPEAAALLASCAARPPQHQHFTARYVLTRDEWDEYVGDRVDRLRAIQNRVFLVAEAADPDAWAGRAPVGVDEAIDAAIAVAADREMAA